MSFWEDLQAWTQAQYDALMLANLKRRKKWTAEDINRLLRDRISKRLKAKQGRAIGAEFLRTGGRLAIENLVSFIQGDHGWLVWPSSVYTVYVWPQLAAYYAVTPGSPTLGTNDEHAAEFAFTTAPTLDPATFSGLARLFIQSIQSVGRPLTYYLSQLGAFWTGMTGQNIGLIRSPAGVYWLTRCADSGLRVAKMAIPAAYADLALLAESGTLDALGQRIADATILSVLELAKVGTTPIQYQIINYYDADWQKVYGTANNFVEKFWGWSWKFQNRKKTDEFVPGAVIVTHKYTLIPATVTRTIEFNECNLTFTWAGDGTPSASIALTQNGFWAGMTGSTYGPSLYTVVGSAIRTMMKPAWVVSPGSGTITTTRPVAVWWAPDGTQKRVEIVGEYSQTDTGETGPLAACCVDTGTDISCAHHTISLRDYTIPYALIDGISHGVTAWQERNEKYKSVTVNKTPIGNPGIWPTTSSGYSRSIAITTSNNPSVFLARYVRGLVWVDDYDQFAITDATFTWTNLAGTGGGFPPAPACSTGGGCSDLTPSMDSSSNYAETPGSVTSTSTTTVTNEVVTIVNGTKYDATSGGAFTILKDMLSDASANFETTVTSSSAVQSAVSYGDIALATGAAVPIDADGASISGIWVGSA